MSVPASSLATVVDSYGLPKPALDAPCLRYRRDVVWDIPMGHLCLPPSDQRSCWTFSIAQSCFPAPLSCQSPYPYSLVAVVTTPSLGILFPFVDQRQG
jgi:hypothetical protein